MFAHKFEAFGLFIFGKVRLSDSVKREGSSNESVVTNLSVFTHKKCSGPLNVKNIRTRKY